MDLREIADSSRRRWTDLQHASFLSCLEESFVRGSLLGFDASCHRRHRLRRCRRPPRLDRILPDSATESTRDLSRNPDRQPDRPADGAAELD
ncbi:uncharacterized protein LOC109728778 [Ananas comosus]|uniref:Uncharacterized protein LOC109728778 n=1 Tax=Ananas comosus TaxID=4615 RepID=A0A6P5HQ25_ANACO|nr:uncharacterized protein LOC109728778 [Ananas comosus]